MGFLDRIFGTTSTSGQEQKSLPWVQLSDQSQLNDLVDRSFSKPQIIYKHSTTCGISSMVLSMFTQSYSFGADQADLYFLDIHRFRTLSNLIAEKFEVRHESPQLILLQNGKVRVHTSHGAITDLDLTTYIQ